MADTLTIHHLDLHKICIKMTCISHSIYLQTPPMDQLHRPVISLVTCRDGYRIGTSRPFETLVTS